MERPEASDTLMLPCELTFKAPTCWHKEELWFDREEHDRYLDLNLEQALIAEGIGESRCPTIDKWAAFSVAGGIIAALSKKYIIPPEPELMGWVADLEMFTWEALWQAFRENQTKLDHQFMAAILRSFLPREHYAPPERPYQESYFASRWRHFEYPDTIMHSIGHIRSERLQKGREALALLPEEIVASIHKVTPHIPTMLEIAIKRIRKTYMW